MKVEWVRWGNWAAHLHLDGKQACPQAHGVMMRNGTAARVVLTELTVSGTPYGRVCERCSRRFRQLFFKNGRIVLPSEEKPDA